MSAARTFISTGARRGWLVAGLAMLACLTVIPSAASGRRALTHVSYLEDFTINGTDSGWFVAQQKGYFEKQGLDVTITPGTGSAFTALAVANGQADFGTVGSTALVSAVAAGEPIQAIASVFGIDGSGIVVSADIKTPKDLIGKTIDGANGLLIPVFNAYLKNAGIAQDAVKLVTVAPAALNTTFTSGASNGCLCFSYSDRLRINATGMKTNFLPFAAYGLATAGQVMIASTNTIKNNPGLVRRFVAASLQGWNFAYDNPNLAAGILQALVPTQSAYATALTNVSTLKAMRKLRYSAAQVGHPYGWESARDWAATIKAMVSGGALTSAPPAASALYTNAFIPGVTSKK